MKSTLFRNLLVPYIDTTLCIVFSQQIEEKNHLTGVDDSSLLHSSFWHFAVFQKSGT